MRTPLSILQDALLARQKALSEYEELDDVHEADRAALGEKEGRLPERAIGGLGVDFKQASDRRARDLSIGVLGWRRVFVFGEEGGKLACGADAN